MKLGYDKPLYILPFDHRSSYGSEVFGFHDPLTPEQTAVVASTKQVIYEGYKLAVAAGAPKDKSGILVDEQFGAAVLRDAKASGYITAMPTEKSGQHEFDFQYGEDFGQHIEAFDPTFTKVLVRYNPEGDKVGNDRQLARLKRLSDWLHQHDRLYMFEMLVPAEQAQLDAAGSKQAYDTQVRPGLMVRAIAEIQDTGIEPDVWKIEGLDDPAHCARSSRWPAATAAITWAASCWDAANRSRRWSTGCKWPPACRASSASRSGDRASCSRSTTCGPARSTRTRRPGRSRTSF